MRCFFYCINNPQLNTAYPYIVVSTYSLKVNPSVILNNQEAKKVDTTEETVEKVQIFIFVNFKDSQIK